MRALDQLKASVNMSASRKAIELPNGSEFEYWMTPLTLAERGRAQKGAKSDDATDFALQLLVNKAKDQNGQPLFAPGEVAELRNHIPASVVEALMLQLLEDSPVDEDNVEELDVKNSRSSSARKAA